jgi:hypothetical protein
LKNSGNNKADIIISERPNEQIFEDRKFLVYGRDKPLKNLSRHLEADPAYTIMVLEGVHDLFFIFCSDEATSINMIDYERKWR